MLPLLRYLRLDTRVTRADKARILAAYLLTGIGLAIVAVSLVWALWPYREVTWEGETAWRGEPPVVVIGEIADVTFTVPYVCNQQGHTLSFDRWVVSGPRDETGTFFRWEIGHVELVAEDGVPYCVDDLPVRVVFPVLYMPGEYRLELASTYYPNPMFPRTVSFSSPPFTVVEVAP